MPETATIKCMSWSRGAMGGSEPWPAGWWTPTTKTRNRRRSADRRALLSALPSSFLACLSVPPSLRGSFRRSEWREGGSRLCAGGTPETTLVRRVKSLRCLQEPVRRPVVRLTHQRACYAPAGQHVVFLQHRFSVSPSGGDGLLRHRGLLCSIMPCRFFSAVVNYDHQMVPANQVHAQEIGDTQNGIAWAQQVCSECQAIDVVRLARRTPGHRRSQNLPPLPEGSYNVSHSTTSTLQEGPQ